MKRLMVFSLSSCDPKIISINQIPWIFNVEYFQDGLIFWLQFSFDSLAWGLEPTE